MSGRLISLLGRALVPFAVFLVFALARRYMPAIAPSSEIAIPKEDFSARFRSAQWIVTISMVVIGIAFAWSTHALLVWLNHSYSISLSSEGFRLWEQPAIWWFFPGFGAATLCWELTLRLWSTFGNRDEASLYNWWSNRRTGFDATKLLRWMALVITLPIGILTVLAIPMHSTLRANDIIECGYAFSACRTYRYVDAMNMTQIDGFRDRDGKLLPRAGIVIEFKDGRRWSSAKWGDFHKTVDPNLTEFLKTKVRIPLEYAATETDLNRNVRDVQR